MNNLKFAILIFINLINYVMSDNKGIDSSFSYLSKINPFKYSEFKDLILFGDSYTTSFINYNTLEYDGEGSVNEEESKNWPLFLISEHHPMNMWNFADSGAVVNNEIIPSDSVPMTDQYEYFTQHMGYGEKYSNWRGDQSLIGIWFGINDIMSRSGDVNVNYNELDESILDCMFNIINKLYDDGARNFLIFNVPAIDSFPYFQANPSNGLHDEVLKYNGNIASRASNFQKLKPDTNVFVYNAYNELNFIMKNVDKYGFTITDRFWLSDGTKKLVDITKEYFWRDGYHPSKFVQEFLSQSIDDFLIMNEKNSQEITQYNNQNNQNEEQCWALKLNTTCCSSNNTIAFSRDNQGAWGIENEKWCGLYPSTINKCYEKYLGKPCNVENHFYNKTYQHENSGSEILIINFSSLFIILISVLFSPIF